MSDHFEYKLDILFEGINDKYLFKAVVIAGGPGSGKSFVSRNAFANTGARLINSDEFFEHLLRKNNLPLDIYNPETPIGDKQQELRKVAKQLASNKSMLFFNGMLPVIVDGTGADYNKIHDQSNMLREFGYDVSMLFVNTSLDVALDRNKMRERTVPEKVVVNYWNKVQNNIGKFQSLFGNNMKIIDNSKRLSDPDKMYEFSLLLAKMCRKFIESPLENRKGLKLIDMVKSVNGKLLSDLKDFKLKKLNI